MQKPSIITKIYRNTHLWIVLTCIGVWILVFLNIFGTKGTTDVYVVGGEIEADVSNTVNTNVSNTVDVNLHEINGHRNCFYGYGNNDYYSIPVTSR